MRPCVLLTALRENPALAKARRLAALHPPSAFRIAADDEAPDIVLHLDSGYIGLADLLQLRRQITKHPTARHFLFSESDWPYAILPGAYPSLTKALPWARSWSYLPDPDHPAAAAFLPRKEPAHLFSFLGRTSTHPIRERLLALDSPDTPCLDLAAAPARFADFDYRRTYRELLLRSQFALCPRGFGASSIRLFEAIALGCAPVIIADAWLPPPDIDWREFSLFVAEKDIMRIPQILEEARGKAASMGERARRVFAAHFAPEIFLDRLLATLVALPHEAGGRAMAGRAWKALGWREGYSLAHRVKMRIRTTAGLTP
ncbi:exostosin family protein [Labrys sp. LIt4]|uniref:exostosin domain-containing protein n=1 Tax=Labrys sp. LIt4 TaxID=2821355 RepID=UPI001ADF9085|nr:exostosin family protein [Labrys sp. LIt4]MBP0581172.1 exostosin family protein [Labrys sp. LIt4]